MRAKEFFQDDANWATLTGTPKQIAYAKDKRRQWAEDCEDEMSKMIMKQHKAGTLKRVDILGQIEAAIAAVTAKLETMSDSSAWINSRNDFSPDYCKRIIGNAMREWVANYKASKGVS